ncbi:GNAT family N-acetyltransferase [Lactiplantibacillus modestisalitolerans]|uniref:GNAT family N-acetyltransferase n=1 Tax=Lactiplantibacillus modestisalitolerans TaxID=1457219 RepID=A0ABV5WWT0_9LACO|nr:GNAT family N-acetyltransferase [Lactiplantibacillus modestisalitolerans]
MSQYVRQATSADLPAIMAIIDQAKQALAAEKIPQWQGAYPQASDLQADIDAHEAWLLIVDQKIAGTATLKTVPDPNYAQIYQGSWVPTPASGYTSIHRIAIAGGYHGAHLGDHFFSQLFTLSYQQGFREVRIDTHASNQRMQHIITKAGFDYRGIVYMANDPADQRLAYQIKL